jgi:hypothetical protein
VSFEKKKNGRRRRRQVIMWVPIEKGGPDFV